MAFLTASQIAKRLKLSISTVKVWRRRGLPNVQIGPRRWVYDERVVAAWVIQEYPEYEDWLRQRGFPEEIQNG